MNTNRSTFLGITCSEALMLLHLVGCSQMGLAFKELLCSKKAEQKLKAITCISTEIMCPLLFKLIDINILPFHQAIQRIKETHLRMNHPD